MYQYRTEKKIKACGDNHQTINKNILFPMSLTQTRKKGFYNINILDMSQTQIVHTT